MKHEEGSKDRWQVLAILQSRQRPCPRTAGQCQHRAGRHTKATCLCAEVCRVKRQKCRIWHGEAETFKAGCAINTHWELGPAVRTFVRLDSLQIQDLLISMKDSSSEFFCACGGSTYLFQTAALNCSHASSCFD